jgi:DNA repair protein RecN (Recombination protein N)
MIQLCCIKIKNKVFFVLCELIIRNFVSIKHLHLHFFSGFSVITGETGIGKSLIFDALSLVLGKRFQSKFSKDQEKIFIEAKFTKEDSVVQLLKEHNIPDEEFLIFKKNKKLYLNNKLINVKFAQKIAQHLIMLHDQKYKFDFMKILDKGLDLSNLRNAYQKYVTENNKYLGYLDEKRKIEQNESYWNMAKDILEALNPKEGEELILLRELEDLKESENLIKSAQLLESYFNTPVDLLAHLSKMMRGCSNDFVKDVEVAYSHLLDLREKINEIKGRCKDSQKKIEDIPL